VQTALNIASSCAPDAACLAATDALYGNEEIGIHYRATNPSTVFVIVDLIGGGIIWDYNVFVEFPDSLGVLAAADPIPPLVLTTDGGSRRDVRLIELTEAVELSGAIDAGGSLPYLSWSLVDAQANVIASFDAFGDDAFGPFSVPAGEYRVVTTGWYPDPVTVTMSTR
jgi:hypothetical protein